MKFRREPMTPAHLAALGSKAKFEDRANALLASAAPNGSRVVGEVVGERVIEPRRRSTGARMTIVASAEQSESRPDVVLIASLTDDERCRLTAMSYRLTGSFGPDLRRRPTTESDSR